MNFTNIIKKVINFFSSLKLTVGLLACATLLIFVATLDQAQNGLRHAQASYIESWLGSPYPIPGGYLIGAIALINLCLAYRHLLKGRKVPLGILFIHTGVLLLIVSSFAAAVTRTEGQLWIHEGAQANIVETTTESELVMSENLGSGKQKIYSIPAKDLYDGETISGFPVQVKVLKILTNAQLGPRDKNETLVTDNDALIVNLFGHLIFPRSRLKHPMGYLKDSDWLVFEKKETFAENEVNAATAVVRFGDETTGGEFILSNLLGETFMPQKFSANGHTYNIALRMVRRALPFALQLDKFTFERYAGTDIPKNFASDVEVFENGRRVRQAHISMNNPLRYGGYTFYQASFDQATEHSTMLMAVKNDSNALPYVAVGLVALGLFVHFAQRFTQMKPRIIEKPYKKSKAKLAAWIAMSLFLFATNFLQASTLPTSPIDVADFAREPVLDGGRVKPLDSVARTALLRLGGHTSVRDGKKTLTAAEWLMRLSQGDQQVNELKVFRIDHPELKTLIGDTNEKYFSFAQLFAVSDALSKAAANLNPESQDPYDKQLGALVKNIIYYTQLRDGFLPGGMFLNEIPTLTPVIRARVNYEYFYNQFSPLLWAQVLYALSFVVFLVAAMKSHQHLTHKISFGFLFAGLGLHLFGVASRIYIQERPPVTNLYSSALFIGAVGVLGCLMIERQLRNRLGAMLGTLIGFATLQISDTLSQSGDTLEMMRAVLDSNFWLSTHVIMVTIGYSAMFVAGGIAALFVIKELFQRAPPEELKKTSTVVYGTLCAALLFSFIGTMLGGIWADQSWGRFWGWDPKENGALMIVLWAALVLHARWGKMVHERGVLVLALGGNIITAWSWFGTNLLGVGLHSYGFTHEGLIALEIFVASQVALAAGAIILSNRKINRG